MKVSLNWIRLMNTNYQTSANTELRDIDKLLEKIGAQLGAVEEVIDLGKKYQGIVIVKVISALKHPDADKLMVCLVDDGGGVKNVKRDKNGLVQIVCGAPNIKSGQLTAWITPGSTVPSTFDKEPFVIEARKIRGVVSNGMLASPKELDLGDSHEGILVLESGSPGDDFAKSLMLDDHIIDIENKMFTHRPDCFGILGVARELAGISHNQYKSPGWYKEDADLPSDGRKNVLKLSVKNELPELVPRFCAAVIKDVKVAPSPIWLQSFLIRSGVRPINNIVDITNWFMLATAQPLHAYDYDKLKTGTLGIRLGKKGEQLKLLGGKSIKIDEAAIVITDGIKPIGLGGVMGGADTEVDKNTKNIVFECANFDMNTTRRTAMAYGLFTDAATRFTKNQSPRQNRAVLVKTVRDCLELVGGRLASPIIDEKSFKSDDNPVKTTLSFINARLGLRLPASEVKKLLENVEFTVKSDGDRIEVTAPFWRTDIEIAEDIVEEVGRLLGYDKLPVALPRRDVEPAKKDVLVEFKNRLRNLMKEAGASEVLTYSFVHQKLIKAAGQNPEEAYRIRNAVSPDLQYYRLSLTPSLLEKVHPNIKAGIGEFALFELGKAHNQKMKDKSGLPAEFEMLSMVTVAKLKSAKMNGAPFFQARRILDYLADKLGINLEYRPLAKPEPYAAAQPFEHTRSAQVWAGKTPLGMVGEYKQSVTADLKLPPYCSGFEIGIEQLMETVPQHAPYQPLNRFPELEQDFCLRASVRYSYQELADFMNKYIRALSKPEGYNYKIEPLDIFQKEGDSGHKQTTWRIILWHQERTLTTAETNRLLDELAQQAKKELKAERM